MYHPFEVCNCVTTRRSARGDLEVPTPRVLLRRDLHVIKGSGVAVLSALAGLALVRLTDERILLLWLDNEMH